MAEKKSKKRDKGATVHIDAVTLKKIEDYQAFIREKHPDMPVPNKGQIVRNSVHYWYNASLGAWL